MGVSINGGIQNGWSRMENPMKVDDLGVPLFQETTIWHLDFDLPEPSPPTDEVMDTQSWAPCITCSSWAVNPRIKKKKHSATNLPLSPFKLP